MNALIITGIKFPAIRQKALETMAQMQYQVDRYREKLSDPETITDPEEAKKVQKQIDWATERENQLSVLVDLINTCEMAIEALQLENQSEYDRGFKAGRANKYREENPINRHNREQHRTAHNLGQYQKWSDHY